jgi:hypothetical protein
MWAHELPPLTPSGRTNDVDNVAVTLTEQPFALPVLVDDRTVIEA